LFNVAIRKDGAALDFPLPYRQVITRDASICRPPVAVGTP
jgi:hypothetical protein